MDALAIIATTYIEGRTEPSGHIHARAIVAALHAAGIELVHRDENHGPTLERAAAVAKCAWVSANYDLIGIANADMANALCEHTEAEIRAMEVKHDG